MPLPPAPANAYGGILGLSYVHTGLNVVHSLHLALAHFDPTPSGPDGDYLYNGTGPVTPGESGVLATFAAVASHWATYYDPVWQLQLVSTWYNSGAGDLPLASTPVAAPVHGVASTSAGLDPRVKRTFFLYSVLGPRWRLRLQKLPPGPVGETLEVSGASGGFDGRDQAWLAYLGGTATGVVARDGQHFSAWAAVRQWWDRPLFGDPAGLPGAPYVVTG